MIAIKDSIHNGRTLVDSGTITNNKFKEQLQMVWYPLVLSSIKDYEKDMVSFDVRWAMNDVETYAFGAHTTTWPPKVLHWATDFTFCMYHITFTIPPVLVYKKYSINIVNLN